MITDTGFSGTRLNSECPENLSFSFPPKKQDFCFLLAVQPPRSKPAGFFSVTAAVTRPVVSFRLTVKIQQVVVFLPSQKDKSEGILP
jgi:hypothetical protein